LITTTKALQCGKACIFGFTKKKAMSRWSIHYPVPCTVYLQCFDAAPKYEQRYEVLKYISRLYQPFSSVQTFGYVAECMKLNMVPEHKISSLNLGFRNLSKIVVILGVHV
jgi:hypothetical protein